MYSFLSERWLHRESTEKINQTPKNVTALPSTELHRLQVGHPEKTGSPSQ